MALTSGQRTFAQHLASLTGLNSRAISVWMLAEESGGAAQQRQAQRNNNWLNIGYFDSGPGAITKDQAFRDPVRAAQYTAAFLKGTKGGAAPGIRAILRTAGQGPEQQLQAIAASPWASSHYGGAGHLVSILKNAPAPGGAGTSVAAPAPATTSIPGQTISTTIPTVDKAAFEQARKLAIVGGLIARRNPNSFLLRSGLLSTQEPSLSDFTGSKTVKDVIPGATVRTPATASASFSTPPAQSGVANFEGKKVAAWIAPALKYARAHGWKGTVNSGYRSFADQTRIYNSGVRPAAKPGTSNHEGTDFPRGAVDVSDAPTLSAILQRSPYGKRLKWAGAKDPVHFSNPHNGSY